jgi:type I restriction enzyme R subunit
MISIAIQTHAFIIFKSVKQIQFILTLKTFILQRGAVEKKDLIQAPFTQLHPQGIRGIFPPGEIEEILGFIQKIGV